MALHHRDLPDIDVIERTGFRVTTPARSIIDVAASLLADVDQVARVVDEGTQNGLLTINELRSRAETLDAEARLEVDRVLRWVTDDVQ